jgi:hypothetical protein
MNWLDTLAGVSDVVSSNWPPQEPKPLWTPGQPSIDIIIPHRGDKILSGKLGHLTLDKPMSVGLLMTLMTCEDALKETNLNYRYIIVANGVADSGPEREGLDGALEFLDKTGRGKVLETPASSPPAARNAGVSAGSGDLLFFFDNHCYVDKNYFTSAVKTFESRNADSVRGITVFTNPRNPSGGSKNHYHYGHDLEKTFLGRWSEIPPVTLLPAALIHSLRSNDRRAPAYRIASSGHGAFAVKRTTWDEVGGYWDGFVGFGGEETYFDFKLALMGKTIWLDPNMSHEHFLLGQKSYKVWAELAENLLVVANVIGGTHWAERNAAYFHSGNVLHGGQDKQYYDAMLRRAIDRSEDHAKWLASKRVRTLEEQLELFKAEHVAGTEHIAESPLSKAFHQWEKAHRLSAPHTAATSA